VSQGEVVKGLVGEASRQVTAAESATHLGSGVVGVYATPAMVAFVERTCQQLVQPRLPAGQTTVGIGIQIRHLAPTPIGATVRVRVEVTAVDDGQITFRAQVWDETELIGEAEHRRAVIDVERFMKRVEALPQARSPIGRGCWWIDQRSCEERLEPVSMADL
jgi:fluoroacetyl-CoA thioesterase